MLNIVVLLASLLFLSNPVFELASDTYHPETLDIDLKVIDTWKKSYRHPLILNISQQNTPQNTLQENQTFNTEPQNSRAHIKLESKMHVSINNIKLFT